MTILTEYVNARINAEERTHWLSLTPEQRAAYLAEVEEYLTIRDRREIDRRGLDHFVPGGTTDDHALLTAITTAHDREVVSPRLDASLAIFTQGRA